MYYAYLLKLGGGFYYVGISQKPAHRLHSHKNGEGSQLSRKYGVEEIMGVWNIGTTSKHTAETIEENLTKVFKYIYGEKVRGARDCKEKGFYPKSGNTKYVQKFPDVTKRVKRQLAEIEMRGWG